MVLPARLLVDGRHPAPHPPQGAAHVAGQLALRRVAGPLGQRRMGQQRVEGVVQPQVAVAVQGGQRPLPGLGLPPGLKLRGQEGKWVLKRAMEPHVPREILYRTKQGFATSLARLFRIQAAEVRARLLGPAMRDCGLFDAEALARLLDEHEAEAFDHSGALWLLLVFEGFLASEMDAAGQSAPALAHA